MSIFENNGWGITVNVGPISYTYYEITFANGDTYGYNVGGGGGGGGAWVSLIGCNDCTPEDLEGLFGDFDLTLILGMGISSDGQTTVFSANLGLGGSIGGSYTKANSTIVNQIQSGNAPTEQNDLGRPVLNEETPSHSVGDMGVAPNNNNSSSNNSNDNDDDDDDQGQGNDNSGGGTGGGSGGNNNGGWPDDNELAGTSGDGDGSWPDDNELTIGTGGGTGGSWDNLWAGDDYSYWAPIVLDLDRDGIEIAMRNFSNVSFDYDNDGFIEQSAWVGADDGLLVIDLNGDGRITQTNEVAFKEWSVTANTDLEGLRDAFDSNNDLVFDENDDRFDEFRVWKDSNSNAVVDAGSFSVTLSLSKGPRCFDKLSMTEVANDNENKFIYLEAS